MKLAKSFFSPMNLWLGASIIFSVILLIVRKEMTGSFHFVFLVWNIFLAGIPLVFSIILKHLHKNKQVHFSVYFMLFFCWLVFFPNAPYIITDLFHLRQRSVPLWFDLMLILSFAWNGLLLGYFSMMNIQEVVDERLNKATGWIMVVVTFFLSGFGVYLGRYLRFNTWDIVSNPKPLFVDIAHRILHPLEHTSTFGVTIIYASFFILSYIGLKTMMNNKVT